MSIKSTCINVFVSWGSCTGDVHLETVRRRKVVTTPPGLLGCGLSPSSIKPLGIYFCRTFTRRFVTHLFTMWLLILAGEYATSCISWDKDEYFGAHSNLWLLVRYLCRLFKRSVERKERKVGENSACYEIDIFNHVWFYEY